jgi:hypothetical protein
MAKLPIPRIERRSRDSVLIDAEDGCYPSVVGSVRQLTSEEVRVYCALHGSWHYEGRVYYTREEAEQVMMWARLGEDRAILVEEIADDETD